MDRTYACVFILMFACSDAAAPAPAEPTASAGSSTTGGAEPMGGSTSSVEPNMSSTGSEQSTGEVEPGSSGDGDASTSTGEASGSDTTGDTGGIATDCDPEACVAECSEVVEGTEDGDYGPCYMPTASYEAWACDVPQLCESIDDWVAAQYPDEFRQRAHCFLDALTSDAVGRVAYQVAFNEWDIRRGTFHLVGGGAALIDAQLEGHCANGGAYGWRPFKTRLMPVVPDFAADSGCAMADDPTVLLECILGTTYADSPLAFPWLQGVCSDEPASCTPQDP